MAKAKLAVAKRNAGEEVNDDKQISALSRISELEAGKNVFGHHSDGFQMVREYPCRSMWKKNPCNDKKLVPWEYSSELSDSQTRYLPWFLLISKVGLISIFSHPHSSHPSPPPDASALRHAKA